MKRRSRLALASTLTLQLMAMSCGGAFALEPSTVTIVDEKAQSVEKDAGVAIAGEKVESNATTETTAGETAGTERSKPESVSAESEIPAAKDIKGTTEAANPVDLGSSKNETQVKETASQETDSKIEPQAKTVEETNAVTEKKEAGAESKEAAASSASKEVAAAESKESIAESKGSSQGKESEQKESEQKETDKWGTVAMTVPLAPTDAGDGPMVVDNDEAVETSETIKYEDLPTDETKTKVKAGAKFPVVIVSEITSKSCKKGDPVEARLKYDLKIGDRLIAPKGSVVRGHVNYALKARCAMHSLVSPTRWYRNSGCVGISFDEIINDKGEHIPLVALPARQARIVKNKAEGRVLGINDSGQVTGPWSQQLRYKAVRIGLDAAMAPAGAFTFGAMPLALGVMGAVNPSFAFMKPVGQNVRHRRIKGFVWGALSGVPGSWIIEDTVIKGQEAIIKPGDQFLAEFQEEFTGEPQTEADMLPGTKTKVHGQVMPTKKM